MTLEDAITILNQHQHNQCNQWKMRASRITAYRWAEALRNDDTCVLLTEFEAIAVAEKYQREDAMQDPPRLETIVAEEQMFEYQRNRCTIYRFLTETQWVGMWEPIDHPHVSYGSMQEWPTAAEAERGLCDEIDRIAKLGA